MTGEMGRRSVNGNGCSADVHRNRFMSSQHLNEVLHLSVRHPRLWIPVGVFALWFAVKVARKLFGDWDGFVEALRYSYKPGWLSLLRGEFGEDVKAEFKLLVWIVVIVVMAFGLKMGVTKLVVMYSLAERFHLPI